MSDQQATILVVDDDREIVGAIANALEKEGYHEDRGAIKRVSISFSKISITYIGGG